MTSVRDILVVAIILFVVALTTVFSVMVGHKVNSEILNVQVVNDSAEAVEVIESVDRAINMSDYVYLALFIGFFISVVMFGWFVGGTPIMAPIYFFIVVFFVFISIILQLTWIDIVSSSELISTVAVLPITNFLMSHLGYFMSVFGLVGILVMFAKPQSPGGL
jgi:hypothetical protein